MRLFGWQRGQLKLLAPPLLVGLLVSAPLVGTLLVALRGDAEIWPHLAAYVLPNAIIDTALLLAGVGIVAGTLGVAAAWIVTAYRFPGRNLLGALLVLPLAMPVYLTAYAYADLLDGIGPVQTLLRQLFGFKSRADYWFPEIRSLGGAIFIMGCVLYPYVYLPARAMFASQSANLLEAATTLGAKRWRLVRHVAIPLARPALAVGLALALLETLNDIGASEYLGVRTLTLSIYTTWLNRNSLPGAAQIACVMLAFVVLLLWLEARGRAARRYTLSLQRPRRPVPIALTGRAGWLAAAACCVPIVLGFFIPAGRLAEEAVLRLARQGIEPELWAALGSTLMLSFAATLVTVGLGFLVASATHTLGGASARMLARLAGLGYAIPATVLALGFLGVFAGFDEGINQITRALFDWSPGGIISGTAAALIVVYSVRFLAIAIGGTQSGLARVSPRIDDAARLLGLPQGQIKSRMHWPLARGAIAAAALLVFVDCMKELSATLLLRPLNVETLATIVYNHASVGSYENGAFAALLIVAVGLIPVLLTVRMTDAGYGNGASSRVKTPAPEYP